MRVNRFVVWGTLMLVCGSCLEPFQPVINEVQESLVVYGVVTDMPGIHYVEVSKSTPYNDPFFRPLTGCVVRVEDNLGNIEVYLESGPGVYEATLDKPFLGVNKSYKLFVNTPDGDEYQSTYDTLLACSPIDTVYYEVETRATADPEVSHHGLQFYSNLTGNQGTSRNYRWKLEETWEYISASPANVLWNGGPVIILTVDSIYRCYLTSPIQGLYSASTRYLEENKLNRNKLVYVSDETPRIRLKYSLLVTQQSLSNEIYNYWETMQSQVTEGGGFYETQPSSTVGNIFNVNSPETKVLGCFYATQEQQKRLTFRPDFDFSARGYSCNLDTIASLDELKTDFPYWLFSLDVMGNGGPPYLSGSRSCFDCRLLGGTNVKPDFW